MRLENPSDREKVRSNRGFEHFPCVCPAQRVVWGSAGWSSNLAPPGRRLQVVTPLRRDMARSAPKLDAFADEQLVELVKAGGQGDLRAFDELVRRHQDRLAANCRYITGSPDDALDLTQEVFVKAYFGLSRFEGRSLFKTWVQRIKVNHCFNFMKRGRNRTFESLDDVPVAAAPQLQVEPTAERDLQNLRDQEVIQLVLEEMNETLRLPLIMCDMDEMPYQDIADELGIGLSAVKMRIKRGRAEFRDRYAAYTGHPTVAS